MGRRKNYEYCLIKYSGPGETLIFPFHSLHHFSLCSCCLRGKGLFVSRCLGKECTAFNGLGWETQPRNLDGG